MPTEILFQTHLVLGYVAWLHDNQPFPFGPLPSGEA